MRVSDTLQRFIFEAAPVRGEYIRLQESYQTIAAQHSYPPALRQLLGEALCVAGLLSAIIKFNGRLSVQFRGNGKLKLLLAQCDNRFRLRGLVKWEGEMSYEELMNAFNEGVLVIMLDGGANQSRYQGIVSWRGNSLVESIEGYFRDSEQLATKLWLSVNETTATGFLLQVTPSSENTQLEKHWERITQRTLQHLLPVDMLHVEYQSLLKSLYPEDDIRLFPEVCVNFGCTCSRKRGADAILVLGREEAEAELKGKQSIAVTCDFCNAEYLYDAVDVAKIFQDDANPPKDIHLH